MIAIRETFDFILVPGRGNSGPDHWISNWSCAFPNSTRVLQREWHKPEPKDWIARLAHAVDHAPRRVVVVAHSLAVATTVKWAAEASAASIDKVVGAFLVAPTNVADLDPDFDTVRSFAPMPLTRLPFPALVVASRNDHRVSFEQASAFAKAWGAGLADAGDLGHMGNEAKLGLWPDGLLLLGRLLEQARL